MTRQAERAPDLAALLDRHWEEIATAWAEIAYQLPDSHYHEQPLGELRLDKVNGSHL
jgi:hypothetical protein